MNAIEKIKSFTLEAQLLEEIHTDSKSTAVLNCKPVREVHGGCTPEEILVPFIVISNKKTDTPAVQKQIHIVEQNTFEKTESKQTAGFEEEDLF